MTKNIAFCLIVLALVISSVAHAESTLPSLLFAGAGLGADMGSSNFNAVGTASGSHKETYLAFGVFLTAEGGVKLSMFGLGIVGLAQWESSRYTFQATNTTIFSSTSYGLTQRRTAWGPTLKFFVPGLPLRFYGEYYPSTSETIVWAEQKSQNPFREGDNLTGYGWGIGIGYAVDRVLFHGTYREFKHKKVSLSGASSDIPGTYFDKGEYAGMFVGASFLFF